MPRSLFSSELEKALMLVYKEVFVGPSGMQLTTNGTQMYFNELNDDFCLCWVNYSTKELNSLALSLRCLLSTCSIPPQCLDTGKWLCCSKEISTKVYIRQLTSKTSSKAPQAQSWTWSAWNFLHCSHASLFPWCSSIPRAIHAVNSHACGCTQVLPAAISGVPVYAVHACLNALLQCSISNRLWYKSPLHILPPPPLVTHYMYSTLRNAASV